MKTQTAERVRRPSSAMDSSMVFRRFSRSPVSSLRVTTSQFGTVPWDTKTRTTASIRTNGCQNVSHGEIKKLP
ncbi:hypothetical protein JTE90_005522 [Oedothorax gibbosus]|uniref:Uncharacterized protein n=1 Tax=Oedothorax gibbosus TaxID=931172 RepID=A0AAV6TCZ8_9ARAC|nr:hypothetical protein JTE90_005522 [Oedothorax gibbosus]